MKTITETRISKILVGRVHNLGNYENIRYEITVDVGTNENPADVVTKLETTLEDLQAVSGVSDYDLRRSKAILEKPESELEEFDRERLEFHRRRIAEHKAAFERRKNAKQQLAKFGGTEVFTDAKLNWDDDDR